MSIRALVWAFEQDIRPATAKFVLVAFADCVNDADGCGYPSVSVICKKTSLDRKTVLGALASLEQRGLIADTGRRAGATRQVKVFRLVGMQTLGDAPAAAPAAPVQPPEQTVPKTGPVPNPAPFKEYRFSHETVPFFPGNGPVFPTERSRKRDTEPKGTINEPKGNHKPKGAGRASALPDWLDREAWDGFVAMRQSIKKPLTEAAVPLAIKKLADMRAAGQDPNAVLSQSVINSWQGLFPVKDESVAAKPQAAAKAARPTSDELWGSVFEKTGRAAPPSAGDVIDVV